MENTNACPMRGPNPWHVAHNVFDNHSAIRTVKLKKITWLKKKIYENWARNEAYAKRHVKKLLYIRPKSDIFSFQMNNPIDVVTIDHWIIL